MSFHKTLTADEIHALSANSYATVAARDADTAWQITENINKVIRVDSPASYYALVSLAPVVWSGFSGGGALGDMVGPASAVDEHIPTFDTTTGKLLQDSGIPISQILPASADFGALDQGGVATVMTTGQVQRLNATFVEVSNQQFTTDAAGTAQYDGVDTTIVSVISTITGAIASGTNIGINFFVVNGNSANTITGFVDAGGGLVEATSSAVHGYTTGDRIIIEDSTNYDDEYTITVTATTTFTFTATFVSTETATHAQVLTLTKASNDFSSSNKNTTLVAQLSLATNGFVYIGVENPNTTANFETEDIHVLVTRI
tara:strand:+ start:15619 stop:16566 length:948 start_codon:yes stop_codon:yes gene_type:complete